MAHSGETAAQIFKSATLTNAQALKLDQDIGTVQPGKRANLLLLREDPTQTIHAYDEIVKVILGGRVLDRTALTFSRGWALIAQFLLEPGVVVASLSPLQLSYIRYS